MNCPEPTGNPAHADARRMLTDVSVPLLRGANLVVQQ